MQQQQQQHYSLSAHPFSIAVELDNLMLGSAAIADLVPQFIDDDEASRREDAAKDFCRRAIQDALDDRLSTAVDLALRGEIKVTAADVLKVCQWAKSEPKQLADDTIDLVVTVAELFAKREAAKAETARASRPKRPKAKVA